MQLLGKAQRVTIYIGESDHYHGQNLYMALLEYLKREGASGATVTRGLAGFGAHSRIHTATIVDLSADLPIKVEWVDATETVERLLPEVRKMVDDGMILVDEVDVVQYAPGRQPDPLAQPVHNIMRTEVLTVQPETPIHEVVTLLLQRGYRSLPVVTADGRLVGIITDGDLLRRANLTARLDLQTELSAGDLQRQLAQLASQAGQAADVMTRPVVTVQAGESVRQAATLMAQRGLKRLPVIDKTGQLVGLVSRVDVLRAVEYHQNGFAHGPEAPHSGVTVATLMYTDVPTVEPQTQLEEIVRALEASRRRRAVVVDKERHVLGIITDGDLLRRSQQAPHPSLINRLRNLVTGQKERPTVLPHAGETAAQLMTTPVVTIRTDTPLSEALRLMLAHQIKRLPVVDGEGRLVGMLGRASLVHGLLGAAAEQQSAAK
jgi:CBS domain-containing protein